MPKSYHCRLNGEGSLQHGDSKGVKRCIWNGASRHGILVLARYLPVISAISNNATAGESVCLRTGNLRRNLAHTDFYYEILVFACPRQYSSLTRSAEILPAAFHGQNFNLGHA